MQTSYFFFIVLSLVVLILLPSSTRSAPFPSSCADLQAIGHSLDGFYLVKNPTTRKIETIFCDFVTSVSQQLMVGNVDVKTRSVHFYVQRKTSFDTANAVIPWEIALLNEGLAMDLQSGIFRAPVTGIYHFEFSGVKEYGASHLYVHLQVNGANIGWGFTKGGEPYDTISLSASLRLKRGSKVNLFTEGSVLVDGPDNHSTHFTGWLVEEDLN